MQLYACVWDVCWKSLTALFVVRHASGETPRLLVFLSLGSPPQLKLCASSALLAPIASLCFTARKSKSVDDSLDFILA